MKVGEAKLGNGAKIEKSVLVMEALVILELRGGNL